MTTTRRAVLFVTAMLASALVVVAVGWTTDLRATFHGALVTVLVGAFLPFVCIAIGLLLLTAIPMVIGMMVAFGEAVDVSGLADGAAAFLQAGVEGLPIYYRFILRLRHPVPWGIALGAVLGVLVLWGVIAWVLLPGETRSAEVLAEVQQRLDAVREDRGRYPAPSEDGHLAWAALGASDRGEWVTDGFGRPVSYEASDSRLFASYQATSLGFDGQPGRDDLCISGSTKLAGLAGVVAAVLRGSEKAEPISDRLERVQALRCPASE